MKTSIILQIVTCFLVISLFGCSNENNIIKPENLSFNSNQLKSDKMLSDSTQNTPSNPSPNEPSDSIQYVPKHTPSDSIFYTLSDSTLHTLFNLLHGEWQWYNTYDAKKGAIKNDFEAIIKFLSTDRDSLIKFQVLKEGVVYKSGEIFIGVSKNGYKASQSIVPNQTAFDEIYFKFSTVDSISFFNYCDDCPIYFYKKID